MSKKSEKTLINLNRYNELLLAEQKLKQIENTLEKFKSIIAAYNIPLDLTLNRDNIKNFVEQWANILKEFKEKK